MHYVLIPEGSWRGSSEMWTSFSLATKEQKPQTQGSSFLYAMDSASDCKIEPRFKP